MSNATSQKVSLDLQAVKQFIPHPIEDHLAGLTLADPAPHDAAFFDIPEGSPTSALSPLVIKAREFIHDLLPPWAENHCYRVYAEGLVVAEIAGWSGAQADVLGWNKELWFLTAMLHDIGWDAQESHESRLSFEIFGGIKAREFLMQWGAEQDIADEVCEAIVRHTEDANSGGARLMSALCQIGPSQDFRAVVTPSLIHPDDMETICRLWPRLGLIDHHDKLMTAEMARKPGCFASQWAPRLLNKVKAGIAVYNGFQGEARDDEEWSERRKRVVLRTSEWHPASGR